MEDGKTSDQGHSSGVVRPMVLIAITLSLMAVLLMSTWVSPAGVRLFLIAGTYMHVELLILQLSVYTKK
jgi:hypothetical protein